MPKKKSSSQKTSKSARALNTETAIRLQKFLAQAGFGSRRECEELIVEGRVTIEGKVVNKLGSRVEPDCLKVRVDGSKVMPTRLQYFVVHKPTGVLSTCRDPEGRMRVIDLIQTDQRVYNVGRLDKSSEGLILVTNDGDLANRLTHPRYGVEKTYHVTVAGNPRWEDLEMLKRGIRLAEAVARVSDVKIKKRHKDVCDLVLVLEEGRNREIRRLLAHIGHKVIRLRRVAIGPLKLGNLKAGDYRRLEPHEIKALLRVSSIVKGKRTRHAKPVETSQLGGWKKKKAARDSNKGDAAAKGGDRKNVTRKKSVRSKAGAKSAGTKSSKTNTRKKPGKKKRVATTESRRGAGRLKKVATKKSAGKKPAKGKKAGTKKGVSKKGVGKKKTARTGKGSSSRHVSSSAKGRKGRTVKGGKGRSPKRR